MPETILDLMRKQRPIQQGVSPRHARTVAGDISRSLRIRYREPQEKYRKYCEIASVVDVVALQGGRDGLFRLGQELQKLPKWERLKLLRIVRIHSLYVDFSFAGQDISIHELLRASLSGNGSRHTQQHRNMSAKL